MKSFDGEVLFLDRSDINTDEIIPARYLTEIRREALKPHLLEDLSLPGFDAKRDIPGKSVIVSRGNFGCGSSREHAPWALEANGIHLVIAEGFARIFRQNMFNCGMMAVTLPKGDVADLVARFAGKPVTVTTDFSNRRFLFEGEGGGHSVPFSISSFDADLVTAGGWVDYADSRY